MPPVNPTRPVNTAPMPDTGAATGSPNSASTSQNIPSSPCDLSALELSRAIHARELGCVELMNASLQRISTLNPVFNPIVSMLEPERLLAQAREHDAMLARGQSLGWMHGFPHAVKDLAQTQGIRTTWGSPLFAEFVPAVDSLHVERIRKAGAILIGKTNTPEFGLGSHTYNRVFGPTRNAWNPSLTCGGSSGGAAVALALRLVPVADGSDMGGSLRNPAGFGNVFGFRPSRGRVPSWPSEDVFFTQLPTDGPMARTVPDLAALLGTMAGPDPRTPLALPDDPGILASGLEGALARRQARKPIRVGWLGDYEGHLPTDPGLLAALEPSLAVLRGLGCEVEASSLGFDAERLWQSFCVLRQMAVAHRLAEAAHDPARRELLKPEARWEIKQGLALNAVQIQQAANVRSAWYQRVLALFNDYDYLALPTAQVFAFEVERPWPDKIGGRTMDSYHRWMEVVSGVTLAGLPAISVPAGFDTRGAPFGLQLVGPPQGDRAVLELAHAYDLASGLSRRRPPVLDSPKA